MGLTVVDRLELRSRFAFFGGFLRRKNRTEYTQGDGAENCRSFDRMPHGDLNLTRAVKVPTRRCYNQQLGRGVSGEAPEVIKRVEAGIVSIAPARLKGVTANKLPAR